MNKHIHLLIAASALLFSASIAWAQDVHSVWGEKPYILRDGDTGATYTAVRGTASLNWEDKTRYGFLNAKLRPLSPILLEYKFTLVAISSCNDDYIEGLWDVYRNGVLVVQGGVGKAYGINQPVGSYFKVYIGDSHCYAEKWHFSAWITNRLDY